MDKHIPINNKITGDKPSKQLFPKQVATQQSLLNQTNRISWPLLNCRPRPTLETFLMSCPHRRLYVGWLVVLGLTALFISVYIGPSYREREKEKRNDRREKKYPNSNNPPPTRTHCKHSRPLPNYDPNQ